MFPSRFILYWTNWVCFSEKHSTYGRKTSQQKHIKLFIPVRDNHSTVKAFLFKYLPQTSTTGRWEIHPKQSRSWRTTDQNKQITEERVRFRQQHTGRGSSWRRTAQTRRSGSLNPSRTSRDTMRDKQTEPQSDRWWVNGTVLLFLRILSCL